MSTNAPCVFIEIRTDQWYYLLGRPDDASQDWRRNAFFHGPFSSDDMAQEHLRQTYPNPGAHQVISLGPGETVYDFESDPVMAGKFKS